MSVMTVEELAAAQAAEYGEYVADGPIVIAGVRAFNDGDPVPKSHVERGVVGKSQVRPASPPSPAGNASLEAWRAFALTRPGVTEAAIEGMSRDELRDQFDPKATDEGNA
jgi:hypothetical protein